MKPPMILTATSLLSLVCAVSQASPATPPHRLEPNAPRSVTVSEAQTPPVIRAGLLQSTLILLPAEEKIATVFGGDTVDWVFDGGHVASRFISIKPKLANTTTDIHIVSDHGNEYTLQLQEISGDADAHFDSKVFILPGDKAAKDRLPAYEPSGQYITKRVISCVRRFI
jgi:type IV secretion system protein VirB9